MPSSPAGVTQRTAAHQLVDPPVSRRGLAGGARGHPAAERRELERLREVAERHGLLAQAPLELRSEQSGVDPRGERHAVHLHRRRQPAQVERDRAREPFAHGLDPAHDARAAAERHHRHALLRAQAQHGRHHPGRVREHHRVGRAGRVARPDPDRSGYERPTACATRVSRSSRTCSAPSAPARRSLSSAGSPGSGSDTWSNGTGGLRTPGSAPSSSRSRSSAAGDSGTACPSSPQPHQRISFRPRAARPVPRAPPRPADGRPRAAGTG